MNEGYEKPMKNLLQNKTWVKCSIVSILFYFILYFFLGRYYGYDNLLMIFILTALLFSDICMLHWWINKNEE